MQRIAVEDLAPTGRAPMHAFPCSKKSFLFILSLSLVFITTHLVFGSLEAQIKRTKEEIEFFTLQTGVVQGSREIMDQRGHCFSLV